ncbi:MAG: GDP-mannose 4,6-dehydratase, partial [Planctomycetes bacterium]|nr:GDP-mannose 4,6-dehydratase [Planctomycetota bacterium]
LTYGPGQSENRFIAQAIAAACADEDLPMTAGNQTREFNHVDDIVEGIVQAAVVPGIEGEIINLACGVDRSIKEVAAMIYRIAGSKGKPLPGALPTRPGEVERFFGCTKKCQRLLNYHPSRTLEEGLKSLVARNRSEGGPSVLPH